MDEMLYIMKVQFSRDAEEAVLGVAHTASWKFKIDK